MGCSHPTTRLNQGSMWKARSCRPLPQPSSQTPIQSCVAAFLSSLRLWKANSLQCSFRCLLQKHSQNLCGARVAVWLLAPICGTQMVGIYRWNQHRHRFPPVSPVSAANPPSDTIDNVKAKNPSQILFNCNRYKMKKKDNETLTYACPLMMPTVRYMRKTHTMTGVRSRTI
jgi:hypothetical protein